MLVAICLMAGQPVVAAQGAISDEPRDGTLVVSLQDGSGAPLAGGCFSVVDAKGSVHEKCDATGSGNVTFERLPYGPMTVNATLVPAGHFPAKPQSAFVVRGSVAFARLTAVAIPQPTIPTIEPTVAPPDVAATEQPAESETPTEESTETPTDVTATEQPVESETPTEEPTIEEESGADETPVRSITGTPQFTCDPLDAGFRDFSVWISADGPVDPAPTAELRLTDRFGNVTGPQTVTLKWEPETSRYIYLIPRSEYAEADFLVKVYGQPVYSVGGGCGVFNPIQLLINTMVQDHQGRDIPDGGQLESGTPFRDTAWFTGDDARFARELAGQQVTYYLYKDDGACTTPVWTDTVVINPDGTIPQSRIFDPSGLGDGIYDWQVAFGGLTLEAPGRSPRATFYPASSSCGAETVVVGQNQTTISTTVMTADGKVVANEATVPIGTTVFDTTRLDAVSADASGTVTYRLFEGTCRNLTLVSEFPPVAVTNGKVPDSPPITPTALGTYQWIVEYSGDQRNAPVTSHCGAEAFTVGQVQPSIDTLMFDERGDKIEQGDTISRGTGVFDAAVIKGIFVPEGGEFTGTVTYTLYLGACPDGKVMGTQTLPVNPDGTLPDSPVFVASEVGTYNWVVTYNDVEGGLNATAVSLCGSETFNVKRTPTTITTTPELRDGDSFTSIPQNGVVTAPADVRDTASIDGLAEDATGTVTYSLYRGSGCSGTPVAQFDPVPLNDDGSVPPSPVVEGLTPGQYNWVAHYSGDDYHAPSSAACGDEQFFVTDEGAGGGYVRTDVRKSANNAIVPDGGHVPLGTSVFDTAQFYGSIRDENGNAAVAGEIVYLLYRGDQCDGDPVAGPWSVPVTAGQPVPDMPATYRFTQAGTYNFKAVFTWTDGDRTVSVESPCGTETVIVDPLKPTLTTHILNMDQDGTEVKPQDRLIRPVNVADSVTFSFGGTNVDGLPGPNGTLEFRIYNNAGCSGDPLLTSESPVVNGEFERSESLALGEDDFGVFNWVVTFTSTDGNYTDATSSCGKETFYLDAQPSLTTTMYRRESGDGDGTVLRNEDTVTVGDWVRDTATITEFATGNPGATGTVTFTLHQGGTCEGTAMYANTVQVAADGTIPSTGWYQIRLFGKYSWSATYSGNNSGGRGGFNNPAESDCLTETFTAAPAPDEASIATVMRQGDTVIPHLAYIFLGAPITDEAVFTNLSDQATGTVTYELHRGSTCTDANLVYSSEKEVVNGIAPISDPYTVPDVGADGQVYSWVVTFSGKDQGKDVELESGCDKEQFRIFNTQIHSVGTTCSYNIETEHMEFSLYLRPRPVSGEDEPVKIVMQPYGMDLEPLEQITIEHEWEIHRSEPWRRVTGTAEWPNGSRATFVIRCNATPRTPELSTTMYQVTDDGDEVMPTGETVVAPGTVVYDTTQVTPATSTIVITGTLTYQLLRGDSCATATPYGDSQVFPLDDTPIGNLPKSGRVTVNDPGTYWWTVTYEPPADDEYPDNLRAVSECEAETFSVEPFETSLTTRIVTATGSSDTAATGEDVYDTATLAWSPDVQPTIMPTGTVTYNAYAGERVCTGEPVWTSGPLALNADGTLPASGITQFLRAGDYEFQAVYSGDDSFPTATSECATEPLRITAPTLKIEKTAHDETISAGEQIGFTIVVTNPGPGVATGVTLSDDLPVVDGIIWSIAGASHASCHDDDGVVRCGPVVLAAGETLQLRITGTTSAQSCGEVANAASFTSENANEGEDAATVTILCPDVVVLKTAGTAEVSAGDQVSFTMTMTNKGPGTAYRAILTDTLPANAGLSWTLSPEVAGCEIEDGVLTCDFGTLKANASKSVTVTSVTTAETCDTLKNTVRVSASNEPEGNVDENNEGSASVDVRCPDVKIEKTTTTSSVNATDPVQFDIKISNAGEGTAYNVQVSDVLPAGLAWTLLAPVDGCKLVTDDATGQQKITCVYDAMEPGTEYTISVVARTSFEACGEYPNGATISADNEPERNTGNNESTATVEVLCSDIVLAKDAEQNAVSAGDEIAFTISMVNNGPGTAYGAVLTDTLPARAGLDWAVDPANEVCAIENGVLTCNVGDLAPKGTFSVRISSDTTAQACGTVENEAVVSFDNAPDEEGGDSIAVHCPDVSLVKTAVEGTINATDTASFQLVITNAGAGRAYDVEVRDELPVGMTGWVVDDEGCVIEDGILTCKFPKMEPGATHTIIVSAPTTHDMCGPHPNGATVGASNEPEEDTENNKSTATISVNCSEVELQKVAERDEISAGDEIAFTISMVNNGEGIAYDAILTDDLPENEGLAWTVDPEVEGCAIEDGVLECQVGDLAPNQTFTVRIQSVTSRETCGVVDNTVVVDFREGSAEPAYASDQATVLCPTPVIRKVADEGQVSSGDQIGFTITASNNGPGNAYDVVLTDTLPAVEGTAWTIAGGDGAESCDITDEGVLTCAFGTMEPESSREVRVVSPTTYATCSVVSNTADLELSNGFPVDSTDEISVRCPQPVVEKVADEAAVSAGDTIGFTITIGNNGEGNAYGVSLADTLPTTPGTAWTIAGGDGAESCTIVDGVLECDFGTLAKGESRSVHITSPTTVQTCGEVDNTAVVNLTNAPSGESSDAVTVNCSDPVIEKVAARNSVSAGDDVSFTVRVTNAGAGNAYDVAMTDPLPIVAGGEWVISGGTGAELCAIEDGVLRCDFGTMAPDAVLDIVVTSPTTASSCAEINNTAVVSASNERAETMEDNSASGSVVVNCPNIRVSKVADADVISAGDEIAFTLRATNAGDGRAYNVVLTDTLPAAEGTDWRIAGGAGAESCLIRGDVLSCDLGTIESGASVDVRITSVTNAATCGAVENTATISADNEPGDVTGDNSSSASVTVNCPDVAIAKTAGRLTARVGDTLSFNLQVTNNGIGTAHDVVVIDRLPAGFDWTASGDAETCAIVDGVLTCEFPALEPGAVVTITVSAIGAREQCGVVKNDASVSASNEPGEARSDNESSASLSLECPPGPTPGVTRPPVTTLPEVGSGRYAGATAAGGLLFVGSLLFAGAGWFLRRREAA